MKNLPDLHAKLQTLFHSTSSILQRLRRSSTAVFKTREAPSFLAVTYQIELWVNYQSIIEQITSKPE